MSHVLARLPLPSALHSVVGFVSLVIVCLSLFLGSAFAAGTNAAKYPNPWLVPIIDLLLDEAESVRNDPDPPSTDLFQISQLSFKGAFRLDSGQHGGSDTRYSVNYAVGTLAYNSQNHSLFIAGHAQASRVAEFPIPTPGTQAAVSDLPVSSPPLQGFTTLFPDLNDQGIDRVTGMLWHNDALIVNAEQWYNANGANTNTTLIVGDADNLNGTVRGFYQMDGRANSAGYMGLIPSELQEQFGGAKFFTGWSSVYSIVSRYSYGPSLWTFDAEAAIQNNGEENSAIDAAAYMNFSYSSELRDAFDAFDPNSAASPLWNILSRGYVGFFVPDTKTFAVIGRSGGVESGIGYKITQDNGNLCGGYCSYDPDDNYNYFWLYDVDEILGADTLSSPRPYAFGKLSLPYDDNGSHGVIGGTLDSDTNTLYLALGNAGQVGRYDRPPLILTFGFNE